MINQQDRDALIKFRINQAIETVDLAKFLINSNKLPVAVNRIYYGMYYTLTAPALQHQFETSKHQQLIGWFNKNFVATNIVEVKFGQMVRNAFQNRRKGDYDAFITFSPEEVELMLSDLIQFIDAIRKIILISANK